MAVIAQQESHHHSLANASTCSNSSEDENIPKGLVSWRDAVERSVTTAQLSMALYVLESCVAWDKSIMKATFDQHLNAEMTALCPLTASSKSDLSHDPNAWQRSIHYRSSTNQLKQLINSSCAAGSQKHQAGIAEEPLETNSVF
ncbi:uncharacterized protein LOC134210307 [Armigeres subalbatus]|uniref:uncharacterized protein LOC134210307 n=1 Tax=Armigeres subalbatus TaxID=124917 RepID=UPI002ED455D9